MPNKPSITDKITGGTLSATEFNTVKNYFENKTDDSVFLAQIVTSKTDFLKVVNHGATSGTTRPSGFTYVLWLGSVEPVNATNLDVWIQTT